MDSPRSGMPSTTSPRGSSDITSLKSHDPPRFSLFPPPRARGLYEGKPLPAVPLFQRPTTSPNTSARRTSGSPGLKHGFYAGRFSETELPGQPVLQHKDVRSHLRLSHPATSPHGTLDPEHILSPQPEQALRKILQLTGTTAHGSDTRTPMNSPTGHNPAQKIRQLTGLDIDMASDPAQVSPISVVTSSSVYSQDLVATISASEAATIPASEAEAPVEGTSYSSAPKELVTGKAIQGQARMSWVPGSPEAITVPSQLTGMMRRHSDPAISPTKLQAAGDGELDNQVVSTYRETIGGVAIQVPRHSPSEHKLPLDSAEGAAAARSRVTFHPLEPVISQEYSALSRPRKAPPAPLQRPITSDSSAKSSLEHPLKSPYPPRTIYRQSAPGHVHSRASKRLSSIGRLFKRQSIAPAPRAKIATLPGEQPTFWAVNPPTASLHHPASVELGAARFSASSHSEGTDQIRRRDLFLPNQSRDAAGPDTPMPPGASGLMGFMAKAKAMGPRGKRKADKRASSDLKSKIRVIPEYSPEAEHSGNWV